MKTYKELMETVLTEKNITVKDLAKALKKDDTILVQDVDGREWALSRNDFEDNDGKTVFVTDNDGGEKEINIKSILKIV